MIRTVNVRTLKDKLSAYLRDVRAGDVVLVSDRGRVVAEIRQPSMHGHCLDAVQDKLERLSERGAVRLGLPNSPGAYDTPDVRLTAKVIDDALAWVRGER